MSTKKKQDLSRRAPRESGVSPRRGKDGTDSGFTIVELLVCVFIVAFGLLAVCAVLLSTTNANRDAAAATFMLGEVRDTMERVKAAAPGGVKAGFDNTAENVVSDASNANIPLDLALVSVTVDDTDPTLLGISITGTWSFAGETQSLTLESIVYNP